MLLVHDYIKELALHYRRTVAIIEELYRRTNFIEELQCSNRPLQRPSLEIRIGIIHSFISGFYFPNANWRHNWENQSNQNSTGQHYVVSTANSTLSSTLTLPRHTELNM
jgi:hypothetical protein